MPGFGYGRYFKYDLSKGDQIMFNLLKTPSAFIYYTKIFYTNPDLNFKGHLFGLLFSSMFKY